MPVVFGIRASAGTCTSSSAISLVSDARSDSFPFWSRALNPGVSVGTTKPRMPRESPGSAVCAQMTATSAMDPLVIHILVPFSTQPSAVSRARVIMPTGFDP